jgi:hypothetical protein
MMSIIICCTVMCVAVLLAVFLLVRKVAAAGSSLPVTAEWIGELSVERYRPMIRLLDGADLEFLQSQPGFNPSMATRLRVQRCQIFRGYLRCLNADFGRVCAAIKLLMLQSRHDRPDLAEALLRQQIQFACGMLAIQFRLFLYRWGLCGVDVTALVGIFDAMRLELRSMVPAAVPAGV